jgi:hypothetical protein
MDRCHLPAAFQTATHQTEEGLFERPISSRWGRSHPLDRRIHRSDASDLQTRPYRQVWFPGDHASVGGGGDVNGLWQAALVWVVEGAQLRGLALMKRHSRDIAPISTTELRSTA